MSTPAAPGGEPMPRTNLYGAPTSLAVREQIDFLVSIGISAETLDSVAGLLDRGDEKDIIGYHTANALAAFIDACAARLGHRLSAAERPTHASEPPSPFSLNADGSVQMQAVPGRLPRATDVPDPFDTDARIAAQIEKLDIREGFWDEDDCHELNALLAIMLAALRTERRLRFEDQTERCREQDAADAEITGLRATLDAREAERKQLRLAMHRIRRLEPVEALRDCPEAHLIDDIQDIARAALVAPSRAASSLSEEPNP